ncbi:hypothetical protein GCM10007415_12310 [Parapedobacter pyrenivorans]|uniref:N-acyl-D-glucosamine 2-epimerase n=1 Tax=Parapedobacter pyrenivorans TaxID=1305674 RepID=A0A917HK46_9SPHI|nr:N-acyl-D-glucosamine 2-epimerase [Parapedobacter pyrenivorans]GGG81245.1 hypothetical protein GCM10007415_12310 [Parapedobacter pyrenivorans]
MMNITYTIVACLLTLASGCKKEKRVSTADETYVIPSEKLAAIHADDVTIQIDPGFAYYQNRSAQSIAEEVKLAGFKAVHYFVVNENQVNGDLIDAFHNEGMRVWLMTLGNGTYSTAGYPAGWEQWKMGLNNSINGAAGFTFLSPFNTDFVSWKKRSLVKLMTTYPFDGLELAEAYFPEWEAIAKGTYGDVGPLAQLAFKTQYGLDMPNFSDPSAEDYYTKKPEVYQQWVDFRVNAVNQFLNELINGEGGVRDARPDALVATWSLAIDAGPKSFERLREDQGLDAAAMVSMVKPDVHYFQTHWPDWVKTEAQLPPDYMRHYQGFVDQLKAVHPNVPIGVQADIGSAKNMIKSAYWVREFNKAASQHSYATWTSYEYHLGGYIYTEPPVPKAAKRTDGKSIVISFSKRIDSATGEDPLNFSFSQRQNPVSVTISSVKVDGNRIKITADDFPASSFDIHFKQIEDTPDLWFHKGFSAHQVDANSTITIE